MEIASPDWLYGHQHGALHDTVSQRGYPQWSWLAVGLRNVDPSGWCWLIFTSQEFGPNTLELLCQDQL